MFKHKRALFIFRRDLRLDDNTALLAALKECQEVIPIFCFDPRQQKEKNNYFSHNCFQFMIESLYDLAMQLKAKNAKLYCFTKDPKEIVEHLIEDHNVDAVYMNRDYTPFSVKRDEQIASICGDHNMPCYLFDDLMLNAPETILTGSGDPFKVFTPYFNAAKKNAVAVPKKCLKSNLYTKDISWSFDDPTKMPHQKNTRLALHGGTKQCRQILKDLDAHEDYKEQRDYPAQKATTYLSAHNKFGTCSIREVFHAIANALGEEHELLRQLYWRDFFTQVAFHAPKVFGHAFQEKYDKVKWKDMKTTEAQEQFKRWCEGKTGFPIVDAGMRELNTTGYMHNRVRMIVASFLTKDLHISWQEGEKYFAQHLIDYDPAVNNGSWQWAASTGCDAQPYFRIFNPWRQQERFDEDAAYIKYWVPELAHLPAKAIHTLAEQRPLDLAESDYPSPIVEHKPAAEKAKAMFKSA